MLEVEIQKAKQNLDHAKRLQKEGSINGLRAEMHGKILKALLSAQKKIQAAEAKYYG